MARVKPKSKPYTTRPKLKFQPKRGARLNAAQAQEVGERLIELADEKQVDGVAGLATTEILEEGMNPASPLHFWFETDDKKAAHEFRLIRARMLPRSIEVVGADGTGDLASWTAFESIPFESINEEGEASRSLRYVPVTVVKERPDIKAQAVARAKLAIANAIRELKRVEELSPIVLLLEEADLQLIN